MTPRPYQVVGRDFLAANSRALLADEMRVGKTPQAILACASVKAGKILVLCPAIGTAHWAREFTRWWPTCPRPPTIVSYDMALRHTERLRQTWSVIIIDEAHFAKNPEAQRTQMIYGQNGLARSAAHIWALSGTPAPSHAGELWPILRAFGRTQLSYSSFLAKYCHLVPSRPYGHKLRVAGTRRDTMPEIQEMLRPIMLRRTRAEVAPEVPRVQYQPLYVDVGGQPPTDRRLLALAKAPVLAAEIEHALQGELYQRTVVFGHHREPINALVWELKRRHIRAQALVGETSSSMREQMISAFHSGGLDVIVANIQAAGVAIDLSAASHGYFLEMDWVPGNNTQAASRLVSVQNPQPVTFDVVTAPCSLDEAVQHSCARRARDTQAIYSGVV